LVVIVYQPASGVTWQAVTSVLKGTGTVTSVGDKAMVGAIELDAQAGSRLVAVLGAGGTLTGDHTAAAAIAKAVIAALP
jgi:multidrug efflux pump subunit AcrA (membrane-fusion protein)